MLMTFAALLQALPSVVTAQDVYSKIGELIPLTNSMKQDEQRDALYGRVCGVLHANLPSLQAQLFGLASIVESGQLGAEHVQLKCSILADLVKNLRDARPIKSATLHILITAMQAAGEQVRRCSHAL